MTLERRGGKRPPRRKEWIGPDGFVAPLCGGVVPAWSRDAPWRFSGDRQFRAGRRSVRRTGTVRANHRRARRFAGGRVAGGAVGLVCTHRRLGRGRAVYHRVPRRGGAPPRPPGPSPPRTPPHPPFSTPF